MPLEYHVPIGSVFPARLATSTLELLRHPFAFTQTDLLSPHQFIKGAKKRGVTLDLPELELLHKRRVLQPFYEVHSQPVGRPFEADLPAKLRSTAVTEVLVALAEGRLSDPAERRYLRWPGQRSRRSLWFSHHQLPVVRYLPYLLTQMERYNKSQPAADIVECSLGPLDKLIRVSFARQRSLAIVLEALTPRYLPRVVGVLRSVDGNDLDELVDFANADDLLPSTGAFGVPVESFVQQADRLLATARQFDPLGTWSRVTRIADPRRWDELRYDALVAQEYRIAAEVLLQFVEDQAQRGRTEPLSTLSGTWRQPQHDRLRVDSRERGKTVMDFKLNNRPSLVLAVEGETEYEIVRRVLGMAGVDHLSSRIAVVNLKGVRGDVNLLARAVAVPHVDLDGDHGALLLSPLTSLMVVADPEDKYKTLEARESVHAGMIKSVVESLPTSLQTAPMRADLEHLLHVRCWPAEFEFAHWSNSEIARALREISADAAAKSCEELCRNVERHRAADDKLKSVWSNWRTKPSKVKLAERLWPDLERRILNSPNPSQIPIVGVVQEAIEITHRITPVRMLAPREDA